MQTHKQFWTLRNKYSDCYCSLYNSKWTKDITKAYHFSCYSSAQHVYQTYFATEDCIIEEWSVTMTYKKES